MVARGVQDEVRGVRGKIACPFLDSDSSVHNQDGGKGENASHRLFYVFALLFFCMRHLADSVQLQVSPCSNLLSRPTVLYHFLLARPLFHYLPRLCHQCHFLRVSCVCGSLCSQRLALCMPCVPVYCSPHQFFSLCVPPLDSSPHVSDCNNTHAVSGGENAYGMGQGENRQRVRKGCTLSQKQGVSTKT